MKVIEVVVGIGDGGAFLISAPPGITVVLRDYDVPDDYEGDDVKTDEDGQDYQEMILDAWPRIAGETRTPRPNPPAR